MRIVKTLVVVSMLAPTGLLDGKNTWIDANHPAIRVPLVEIGRSSVGESFCWESDFDFK